MSRIIVDTSALVAFFIRSETYHQAARDFVMNNRDRQWIVIRSVFDETVTLLRSRVSAKVFIEVGQVLRENHIYIPLSDIDDEETWKIFSQYDDKAWSYTDCLFLAIARRLSVFEVFSFDAHFRQMSGLGIICQPRSPNSNK
ncbi:MAG: PIN domain-containing protein [Cyanobacteria bacterium P01_E01_bin.42]